jgi:hypothetical protein
MKTITAESRSQTPSTPSVPAVPFYSAAGMRRAGQKLARYWKAIEARNLRALRAKVAAKTAAGWIPDGPPVEVSSYVRSRTQPRHRFSQSMVIMPAR